MGQIDLMASTATRQESALFPSEAEGAIRLADPAAPRARIGLHLAARAWARLNWASAFVVIGAILLGLGMVGTPFAPGGAYALQAKAGTLNARWSQLVAEGVPSADLAALQRESANAEKTKFLSVASVFWWPDAGAILDRWQAQTDAIWARNVSQDRSAAIAAEAKLHQALGAEPVVQRKERLGVLAQASTPTDFLALRFDWDLETKMVPVDRDVAASVGVVTDLVAEAKALGILSDPAAAVLADANRYTFVDASARAVRSGPLMAEMTGLQQDLRARLDAAAIANSTFGGAAAELSLANAYGVNVAGYQSQIDSEHLSYSTATSAAQFNVVTSHLNQISAAAHGEYRAAVARAYHIVYGVPVYYQAHSLSCEETATSMALAHQGIYLSQDQILQEMGADTRPMYVDGNGTVRWGNPYEQFVGNVNGSEHNYTGYQANYPPLVRVARAHGASIVGAGPMSAETIYANIIANHPVVVYATYDWAWHPRHDYLSFDGQWIPWIGPNVDAHVYTAVGVNPWSVLVDDPIRGQYWVSKSAFEAAFSVFGEAIVFA
jgi:uncharacterized protein YvpB